MTEMTPIQRRIYDAFENVAFDPVAMRDAANRLLREGVPAREILFMMLPPEEDEWGTEVADARMMITEGPVVID